MGLILCLYSVLSLELIYFFGPFLKRCSFEAVNL